VVGSPIGCVVFLCEIEKKMRDLARKGLTIIVSAGSRTKLKFVLRESKEFFLSMYFYIVPCIYVCYW